MPERFGEEESLYLSSQAKTNPVTRTTKTPRTALSQKRGLQALCQRISETFAPIHFPTFPSTMVIHTF